MFVIPEDMCSTLEEMEVAPLTAAQAPVRVRTWRNLWVYQAFTDPWTCVSF